MYLGTIHITLIAIASGLYDNCYCLKLSQRRLMQWRMFAVHSTCVITHQLYAYTTQPCTHAHIKRARPNHARHKHARLHTLNIHAPSMYAPSMHASSMMPQACTPHACTPQACTRCTPARLGMAYSTHTQGRQKVQQNISYANELCRYTVSIHLQLPTAGVMQLCVYNIIAVVCT